MTKETPMMTWYMGRGYNRYSFEKRIKKFLPVLLVCEFIFCVGAYFLIRFASFFGDDWFQWWDYPTSLVAAGVGVVLFNLLVRFFVNISQGQKVKLYPDRIEMEVSTGEHGGTVTFTSPFQDMIAGKMTDITQAPYPFLLVDLELKPDPGNMFTRKARILQFGIPKEIDSAAILRAFEQNHVPLSRH